MLFTLCYPKWFLLCEMAIEIILELNELPLFIYSRLRYGMRMMIPWKWTATVSLRLALQVSIVFVLDG